MASSGGGCNKRHRQDSSCTDDDNAEISSGGKSCGVAPRSASSGGKSCGVAPRSASSGGKSCGVAPRSASIGGTGAHIDGGDGDVHGGRAQETADDDGAGEDDMYLYDDDEDAEKAKEDDAACDKEQRYAVLTEDNVRARQEADTARVTEVLSIPEGFAAVLLRHFKWRVGRVQEEWFSDDRRVRDAVGLDSALVPTSRSPRSHVCGICFDEYPAGWTRSAGCSHYYCDGCWRGYIHAAVGDGSMCLSLRCPDPACSAAVVLGLVDAVADAEDKDRYARFALRSYVEDSGGGIKWCPAPGCTRAVEYLGSAGDGDGNATDVFCDCRHGFCWSCGEEAHRPVSCDTVRAWLATNMSDAETANWILTNTKDCPSCRRPIEKNQGCNHMTCSAPCRHQFCWLCFDPWNDHKGCTRYDYRQRQEVDGKSAVGKEATRRGQAKASLDRYLYHYERWEANRRSLHKVLADMDQLECSELERMARAVDLPATELGFVTEAYHQIADGRRVLRWAHAYGYFLDPERDAAKRGLFDDLQSQANRWLECLHGCAELERKELFVGANNGEPAVAADTFRAYREKVANLTGVTRKFLGNLVKAFETDLPEVVKPAFLQIGATSMGLPDTEATPIQVHMSNMISSGVTSTPSVIFSMSGTGQPIGTQRMVQSTAIGSFGSNTSTVSGNSNIAASSSQPNSMGMGQQAGVNSLGVTNNSAMNVLLGQHPNAQQPPPNYVKIWEGILAGQRQGQPVFISKLESWSGTASETLAAGWPETMQIVRLIAQEHMNNKQYVEKADFLIFRTLNQHRFLQQLQEKKLCAVIQLPSQTLLLSMSDEADRLIGMLFPGNVVVFKPQFLTQQPTMQQLLHQQQQLQHQQQLQLQQQQLQQQQQMQHQQQQMQQIQQQQQQMQRMQHQQQLMQQIQQQQQLQHQQQLQQQKHMQQMQHQQQYMQDSTQQPPMQQHKLQQQQLQQQQQMQQMQQQQQMQQIQQQQLRHQQQLQQQQMQQHQMQQMQQQTQQMQPQQQSPSQMVGTESGSADDARED